MLRGTPTVRVELAFAAFANALLHAREHVRRGLFFTQGAAQHRAQGFVRLGRRGGAFAAFEVVGGVLAGVGARVAHRIFSPILRSTLALSMLRARCSRLFTVPSAKPVISDSSS